MTARACFILLGSLAFCSTQTARAEQKHDLADVLRRAGSYIEEFQNQLSGIVAEENYLQEVVPFLGMNARGNVPFQRRRLLSDLLLLRPDGAVTWVQFRDVFDVDGRPVRDRAERLTALFLSPGLSSEERVREIRSQSARYNIGGIQRTMNVPALPLAVLAFPSQPRFAFTVEDAGEKGRRGMSDNGLASAPTFRAAAEVWTVKFEERHGPTLVQTRNGRDILSRGRFWIEPETGRVLMSELITEDGQVRGELLVSYQSEPLLGFLVPIELREKYSSPGYRATITGKATYSRFRRFQVDVDEAIGSIRQ